MEWLYSGDYSYPLPKELLTSDRDVDPPGTVSSDEDAITWDLEEGYGIHPRFRREFSRGLTKAVKKDIAIRSFKDLEDLHHLSSPEGPTSRRDVFEEWRKQARATSGLLPYDLDYSPTLMAHAKIYALSNYMLLPQLQDLAAHRI